MNDTKKKEIMYKEIQFEFDKKESDLKLQKTISDEKLNQQLLLAKQKEQEIELDKKALTVASQKDEIQHLAYLKQQALLEKEKAEKNEKDKQLTVSEKEKQLQSSKLQVVNNEKALQLSELNANSLQKNLIATAGSIIIILLLFSLYTYRNYQVRKLLEIRNKISRDLHDDIATSFSNTSGSAVSAKWDFGDPAAVKGGDTSSGLKTSHIYRTGGKFKVKMVVANIAGCKDSNSQNITVDSLPKVSFKIPNSICAKAPALFTNTSPVTSDSFSWIFGDGLSDSLPSHIYAKDSIYKVSLVATNAKGCMDTLKQSVTVHPLPLASFTTGKWTYRNFNFRANDTILTSYSWDFGDSTALGTGFKVGHSFAHDALYLVKLNVTNSFGCTASTDTALNVKLNGINQSITKDLHFGVYPNPFTDNTQIEYTVPERTDNHLVLTDITGKHIADIVNAEQVAGTYTYMINASTLGLKPGIYIINAIISGVSVSRQIIKLE